MAFGAITQVNMDPHSSTQAIPIAIGDVKMTSTNIVGDAAYGTGGTALTPANVGLSAILNAQCEITGGASNNGAVTAIYNQATGKLQCYTTGTTGALVECGSVNLSGLTINVLAFGY